MNGKLNNGRTVNSPRINDRTIVDPNAKPTGKPDRPCFNCGSRDWCSHNPEPWGVATQ